MLTVTVAQDGSGDFASIAEAVLAVPYEEEALVQVGPGIYREKLVCEKRCITLRGAGADKTKLVWGDGGKLPHKDGRPTHTFRSYTAFFSGEKLRVEDMTIENDAGPGAKAGQAIAAYVDSARAAFSRVRLLGNQDTLFCAPLPEKEREKDGFLGPRVLAPRRASAQYYHACEIAGDIDFIFGGADALFEHCTLRTVDNGLAHSWVTAPSGAAAGLREALFSRQSLSVFHCPFPPPCLLCPGETPRGHRCRGAGPACAAEACPPGFVPGRISAVPCRPGQAPGISHILGFERGPGEVYGPWPPGLPQPHPF